MGKLIITGDEHVRSEEPFYSAKKEYFNWVIEQDFNNDSNIMINTGDFFHTRSPTPNDYSLAYYYLRNCKFKTIYILRGNDAHEFNVSKKTYATAPLEKIRDSIIVVKKPQIINEDNLSILLMPFIPSWELDGITLKEYYEHYVEQLVEKGQDEFDYIIGHFFHKNGFGDDINISKLKGKRRMGHNHVPSKDGEYVGINTITRADEAGCDLHLNIIDTEIKEETYIDIPRFLDYAKLDYEVDKVREKPPAKYTLYNVVNAPDEKSIYEKYGDIYINKWEGRRKQEGDKSNIIESTESQSLTEFFDIFAKNKKLKKELKNKLQELIKEKE